MASTHFMDHHVAQYDVVARINHFEGRRIPSQVGGKERPCVALPAALSIGSGASTLCEMLAWQSCGPSDWASVVVVVGAAVVGVAEVVTDDSAASDGLLSSPQPAVMTANVTSPKARLI